MNPGFNQTTFQECLRALHVPEVRDLAWVVGAPPLVKPFPGMPAFEPEFYHRQLARSWSTLLSLNRNPQSLQSFLQDHPTKRLGLYVEMLIRYWLNHHDAYELIAHNIPVQEGNVTRGAFDFLVQPRSGKAEHWEVTAKFYLKRKRGRTLADWVGPGKRDRFDIKLDRMMNHQLPLSSTGAGLKTLAGLGIDKSPITRAWIKGVLFRHWLEPGDVLPGEVLWQGPEGIWCEAHEFSRYVETLSGDWGWVLRIKPDWLAATCVAWEQLLSRSQMIDRAETGLFDSPAMFSGVTTDSSGNALEDHRLFIVPDGWASG